MAPTDDRNPRKQARHEEDEVNTDGELISAGEAFFEALGMHLTVLDYPRTMAHFISS